MWDFYGWLCIMLTPVSRWPAPKIEVSAYDRECICEKFKETSQRPVWWLLSTSRYCLVSQRCTMRNEKYEQDPPTALARHRHRRQQLLFRNSEECVQLGASQRSWHGALFRLGETRFEEGRRNSHAAPSSVAWILNISNGTSPCGHRIWSFRIFSGKTHFRSYGNGILRFDPDRIIW